MANILSQVGITSGSTVQAGHITQSIDAFSGTQAYDIKLSGSLTITGSVILDTPIDKNFHGTASYAITSSTVDSGFSSIYAANTVYADNETSMFQLYNEQTTISPSSTFYIGTGTVSLESSSVGFSFPYDSGRIVKASIVSTVLGSVGLVTADASIFKNNTKIHNFNHSVDYSSTIYRDVNTLDISATASLGDIIYVKFITNDGTEATDVIHNINLFIKRNG